MFLPLALSALSRRFAEHLTLLSLDLLSVPLRGCQRAIFLSPMLQKD